MSFILEYLQFFPVYQTLASLVIAALSAPLPHLIFTTFVLLLIYMIAAEMKKR